MKKISLRLMFVLPLTYLILLSVFSYFKYPLLLPTHFTLEYWSDVLFKNPLFYKALISSLSIAFLTALFSTVIGFMTGRAVVYHLGGYSKSLALIISLPLLIPGMILFLGMHQILAYTPFSNSVFGVVLVHTVICLPYTCNIAVAYFTGIPKAYEELSKTLGSTYTETFRRITLPLLMPGITLSVMISFLISNTEYFSTFLIGGGQVVSLSMVMFPYISNADYGHSSVMGLIFISLHLVLFLVLDKKVKQEVDTFYGGN